MPPIRPAAPFRPRRYTEHPVDLTLVQSLRDRLRHDEPQRPITFIDDTQGQIDADLRGVTRAMLLGAIAALIAVALIWWAQS